MLTDHFTISITNIAVTVNKIEKLFQRFPRIRLLLSVEGPCFVVRLSVSLTSWISRDGHKIEKLFY